MNPGLSSPSTRPLTSSAWQALPLTADFWALQPGAALSSLSPSGSLLTPVDFEICFGVGGFPQQQVPFSPDKIFSGGSVCDQFSSIKSSQKLLSVMDRSCRVHVARGSPRRQPHSSCPPCRSWLHRNTLAKAGQTEFSVTKQQSGVCLRPEGVSVLFESPAHGSPAARLFNCEAATGAEDAGTPGHLAWLCVMWSLGSVGSPRSSTGSNAILRTPYWIVFSTVTA